MFKRKARNVLTLREKLAVVEDINSGLSYEAVAAKYNISISSVRKYEQHQSQFHEVLLKDPKKGSLKTQRTGKNPKLDAAVFAWFQKASTSGSVSGVKLRAKAKEIADNMGIETFLASCEWLKAFKKRHGIDAEYQANEFDCEETFEEDFMRSPKSDNSALFESNLDASCFVQLTLNSPPSDASETDCLLGTPFEVKLETDLCRFCGEYTNADASYNFTDPNLMIEFKMKRVFNVQLDTHKNLPQNICMQCFGSLEHSSVFLETFERTQRILLSEMDKTEGESLVNIMPPDVKIEVNSLENVAEESTKSVSSSSNLGFNGTKKRKLRKTTERISKLKIKPVVDKTKSNEKANNDTPSLISLIRLNNGKRNAKTNSFPTMPTRNPVLTVEDIFAKELSEGFCGRIPDQLNDIDVHERNPDGTLNELGVQKLTKLGWFDCSWKCIQCGCFFDSRLILEEHFKNLHPDKPIKYFCIDCGADFKAIFGAHNHMIERHKPYKKFFCDICHEFRWNLFDLHKHRKEHHPTLKNTCLYCGRIFVFSAKLMEHAGGHMEFKDEDLLHCDLCDFKTHAKLLMSQHVIMKHTKKENVCDQCGKICKDLHSHRAVHRQDRPFACDLCEWTFKCRDSLRHHRLRHFPKKEQCPVCGKKFLSKAKLKKHYIIHTDDFLYSCEFCGKKFKHSSGFNTHRRIHTGERPYICSFEGCEQAFIDFSNMSKHMKTKHNVAKPRRR